MADEATGEGYAQRVGVAEDEALNVIWLDGRPDQTISLHAALEARKGTRWACILCRILSVAIEKDHCEKQFTRAPTSTLAAIRAFLALLVLLAPFAGLWFLARWAVTLMG